MKRTDENHSFNINVCQVIGGHVQKAILLKEIYGWILINVKKKNNVKHGLVWTYMSAQQFSEKFPYMASKSIDRWLRQLQNEKWLRVGNFNKAAYDKTKWYTIDWRRYDLAVLGESQSLPQNEEWITQIEECIDQNEESFAHIEESMYQTEEPIPTPTQLQNQKNKDIEDLRERNSILAEKLEIALKAIEEAKKEKPKREKRKKFVPPTLEEVTQDFIKKGSTKVEAEKLFYHYESNGWKVGKNKMVSWEKAISGWISRNKPASGTASQTKNLVKQYQDHIQKYLTDKQRSSMNGQLLGYISKAEEKTVQGEISALKSKLAHITNPTFTDALVFDFCYGSISTLSGSGTTPQKALSKFRQWYDKLSEYKQNKSDLRTDYKNFLIKYS